MGWIVILYVLSLALVLATTILEIIVSVAAGTVYMLAKDVVVACCASTLYDVAIYPPIKSNGLIVADAFAVAVARLAVAELADA